MEWLAGGRGGKDGNVRRGEEARDQSNLITELRGVTKLAAKPERRRRCGRE